VAGVGTPALRIFGSLCLLFFARSSEAQSTTWTFGGFADIGYLFAPNDPLNDLFRSRGTTWHLSDAHLNMAGVYARRSPAPDSRWGVEATMHAG
jgi:hypothetical protein